MKKLMLLLLLSFNAVADNYISVGYRDSQKLSDLEISKDYRLQWDWRGYADWFVYTGGIYIGRSTASTTQGGYLGAGVRFKGVDLTVNVNAEDIKEEWHIMTLDPCRKGCELTYIDTDYMQNYYLKAAYDIGKFRPSIEYRMVTNEKGSGDKSHYLAGGFEYNFSVFSQASFARVHYGREMLTVNIGLKF